MQALNTLLVSDDSRRGFTAKVSDFGLSLKVEESQASISGSIKGTGPYIAPEVYTSGTHSAAADVYAFGITLWELLTAGDPLHSVPRLMLAQQVVVNHLRPAFPPGAPPGYVALAQRCWDPLPSARPSFSEVLSCLGQMMAQSPACLPAAPALASLGSSVHLCCEDGHKMPSGSPREPVQSLETPVERVLRLLDQLLSGEQVDLREVRGVALEAAQ